MTTRPPIIPLFIYALCLAALLSAVAPQIPLYYFAPPLCYSLYSLNKKTCLKLAIASGFFIDLLASHSPLGFIALLHFLALEAMMPLKQHFFSDRFITFPFLTLAFSFFIVFFQALLTSFTGQPFLLNAGWFFHHLITVPLWNGAYCLIFFVYPLSLFYKRRATI
ncbi:MAG: hypothetical protein LW832_00685 [Parachlamydia sp.]|nr:hypothetical protein [Parachlamydia sp.]